MSRRDNPPATVVRLAALWAALVVSCGREGGLCESGSCPAGFSCDGDSGQCRPATPAAGPELAFSAPITTVAGGGDPPVVVGYVAERQSLAVTAGLQVAWLAGPAADSQDPPAGQVSTAAVAADGTIHVAWLRSSDATLWHAKGRVGMAWQRQRVAAVAAGAAAAPLALVVSGGQAVVAYRDPLQRQVAVARRGGDAGWIVEAVPLPAPPKDGSPTLDVGRSLALVSLHSGLAVSAYDATHGDLLLAIRSSSGWAVSRIDGSHPESGADTGDVGHPSAMAVGPDGSPVIAYRDRSHGQIRMARVTAGVMTTVKVVEAQRAGPNATVQQTLRGTGLTVAVRPDGRAVIGWFDGSDWSIGCVEQLATGHFAELPVDNGGYPRQLWPSLLQQPHGLWLSWVALDPQRGPMGTRLVQRKLAAEQP